MPRLTNRLTGQVVNVDVALAAKLGAEWSAEKPKPVPRKGKTSGSVNADED